MIRYEIDAALFSMEDARRHLVAVDPAGPVRAQPVRRGRGPDPPDRRQPPGPEPRREVGPSSNRRAAPAAPASGRSGPISSGRPKPIAPIGGVLLHSRSSDAPRTTRTLGFQELSRSRRRAVRHGRDRHRRAQRLRQEQHRRRHHLGARRAERQEPPRRPHGRRDLRRQRRPQGDGRGRGPPAPARRRRAAEDRPGRCPDSTASRPSTAMADPRPTGRRRAAALRATSRSAAGSIAPARAST